MNRCRARPVLAFALVSVSLLAAGCAKANGAAEGPSPAPQSGTLVVTQKRSGPLFVEGSVGYVRLTRSGAATALFEVQVPSNGLTRSVLAGSYQLVSYQRICTGNCGHLGPPSITCSTSMRVPSGGAVNVTVNLTPASNRCTLTVSMTA
jgi:hypothetical protein